MAIRLPLQNILTAIDTGDLGAGSVAGGVAFNFMMPQDSDGGVVKFQASISGAAVSAVLQTTDDGGTTWYDVARTSVISRAVNANAQWLGFGTMSTPNPRVGGGISVLGGAIGNAGASTLGSQQVSGLPILSPLNRIFFIYTGDVTASSLVQAKVMVNSQSATA